MKNISLISNQKRTIFQQELILNYINKTTHQLICRNQNFFLPDVLLLTGVRALLQRS